MIRIPGERHRSANGAWSFVARGQRRRKFERPSNRALKVRLKSCNYGAEKQFGRIAFGERKFRKPVTLVEMISPLSNRQLVRSSTSASLKSSRCSRAALRADPLDYQNRGKSNLPGLCFACQRSRVMRSSSAEAGAPAGAEEHRPLGKSSILNPQRAHRIQR
jgi:hypothetical protein